MAHRCQITGKRNNVANHRSNSNIAKKRLQKANLHKKRVFVPELGRAVTLKLSTRAIRTLNKKPLVELLRDNGLTLDDVK